jgi:hypothetical protein
MKISNPKTTVGGLPLATTWYVNTRIKQTKDYVDDLAAFLSGYTEKEVGAATAKAIDRENNISSLLSAQSDTNDKEMVEAFCRYITGNSTNGAPTTFVQNFLPTTEPYALKEYGYAYLGPDKKIAHELMPDISLMDVTTVDVKEIYDYMKTTGWLDSATEKTVDTIVFAGEDANNPVARNFWTAATAAGTNVEKVVAVVKALLEKYVLLTQTTTGKMYAAGDILVVTCYDDADKTFAAKVAKEAKAFIEVFSQSFIGGGWICSSQARNDENSQTPVNTAVKFTKLSFNQGEVISVNNLIPNANGNVSVNLANVLLINNEGKDGEVIGEILAHNIQQIRDVTADANALNTVPTGTGLVTPKDFATRFVFNDRTRNAGYAYTTLDEFADLNIKAKEVTDIISAALVAEVDRATATEQSISDTLSAEIDRSTAYDTYLSGVVGTEADLSGVTVTSALLALKQHTEVTATTAEANFDKLAAEVNTDAYDLLKVYTCVIEAGSVTDVAAVMAPSGISVSAIAYTDKYTQIEGWDTVYADPFISDETDLIGSDETLRVYNYFGIKPSAVGNDIAEITIGGFTGRILDIYAFDAAKGTYELIDADVRYKEVTDDKTDGSKKIVAEFVLLGEYNKASGETATHTKLDKLVIRYTKKHTYEPAAFEVNPLFK